MPRHNAVAQTGKVLKQCQGPVLKRFQPRQVAPTKFAVSHHSGRFSRYSRYMKGLDAQELRLGGQVHNTVF